MNQLGRFIKPQDMYYKTALREIQKGKKKSHWMWFVFPQIKGLGYSDIAKYFEIQSRREANAYLAHPVLGSHLVEISEALLELDTDNIDEVMGWPDNAKLQSSMTLFYLLGNNDVFGRVLDKFFGGELDTRSVNIITDMRD